MKHFFPQIYSQKRCVRNLSENLPSRPLPVCSPHWITMTALLSNMSVIEVCNILCCFPSHIRTHRILGHICATLVIEFIFCDNLPIYERFMSFVLLVVLYVSVALNSQEKSQLNQKF